MKVSNHFSDWELFSPKLLEAIHDKDLPGEWFVQEDAIDFLEDLREFYGSPVSINQPTKELLHRGICTDDENLKQGRTLTSQHNFCAFDISLYDEDIYSVYQWIKKNAKLYGIGAIGLYDNFIHIDFRNSDKLVEWDNRNKK